MADLELIPETILWMILPIVVSFFVVYVTTPRLIKSLEKRNQTVKDYHREGGADIPRPGGPSIILGVIASSITLYLVVSSGIIDTESLATPLESDNAIDPKLTALAMIIVPSLAFLIGLVDDFKVMGGYFKPVALAASSIPIILLSAYDHHLLFPLFGPVDIPLLYLGVIVAMISVTGNTVNSIDVLNGAASGFVAIASFSLAVSLLILGNITAAVSAFSLGIVSVAFYRYHKFPSRIFPGDSGALALGAAYGTIAITGQIEMIAAVAMLPAAVNSFLFLSSVKRIIEHRQVKAKPVSLTKDYKLVPTKDKDAPVTLVRLILVGSGKALSEKEIVGVIMKLTVFSGILAIITAYLYTIRIM